MVTRHAEKPPRTLRLAREAGRILVQLSCQTDSRTSRLMRNMPHVRQYVLQCFVDDLGRNASGKYHNPRMAPDTKKTQNVRLRGRRRMLWPGAQQQK